MYLLFYRNPFAFANVPLLPSGFCFRLPIRFSLQLLLPATAAAAAARRASRTYFQK
ncbi:hypothetical protein [Methanimicrococcus hongohii]|uniref:hypothetical protein n=1 Tax=Methanimicrococcus hongohii TaxID=3028295 RepID=UPI00293143BA|nr:hypothetical protein [Methanimicrococcus sp. Hf6]